MGFCKLKKEVAVGGETEIRMDFIYDIVFDG